MARSSDEAADDPTTERVIVTIDGLEALSAIGESLDRIRKSIDWWLSNRRRDEWLPVQPVTTLPDAAATPTTVQSLRTVAPDGRPMPLCHHPVPTAPDTQTATAPAEGLDDETQFCCEAPDLQWTGDPHFPGVACMNCGYIVADCGSVVMQPSPEADPDPEPQEQQRALFSDD